MPDRSRSPDPASQPDMPGKKRETGIWLTLLVFIFIVGRPLWHGVTQSLVLTRQLQADPAIWYDIVWQRHCRIIWGVFFLTSILSVSAGVVLWKVRRPAAVWYAVAVLWLAWPGAYLAQCAGWLLYGDPVHAALLLLAERQSLVLSCLMPLVWTCYLYRSRRVRARYWPDST